MPRKNQSYLPDNPTSPCADIGWVSHTRSIPPGSNQIDQRRSMAVSVEVKTG